LGNHSVCHVLLPPNTLANLRTRLRIRAQRVRAAQRIGQRDLFYLSRELSVYAPFLSAATLRKWRTDAYWWRYHAERDVDKFRRLEALILRYEPEGDAWLRRRLGELEEPQSPIRAPRPEKDGAR
jgi:hypothetical protein